MTDKEHKVFADHMRKRLIELGLVKRYSPELQLTLDAIKGKIDNHSKEQMLKVLNDD